MKILGKKQLSKLSFFEYIAGITIGDIAGTMSMDEELSLTNGITSILVWSLVPIVISSLQLRFKKFRDFVEGTPTTFIEDGKIIEKAMRKEKYSVDELLEQLRKNDVFRVADVEFAELDSNGDLSLILKQGKQPVTLEDLNIQRRQILQPHAVISDGKIDENALQKTGYTQDWLVMKLNENNVTIDQVFLAQLDRDGNFTYDLLDQYDTK
jgi:uncharacterized membrane protein YcaP (DUF421 family)